jgi:hypothetical protein
MSFDPEEFRRARQRAERPQRRKGSSSAMGLVSCLISIPAGLLTIPVAVVYLQFRERGANPVQAAGIFPCVIVLIAGMALLGGVLGFAAMSRRGSQFFALLGVLLNGGVLAVVGLIVLTAARHVRISP